MKLGKRKQMAAGLGAVRRCICEEYPTDSPELRSLVLVCRVCSLRPVPLARAQAPFALMWNWKMALKSLKKFLRARGRRGANKLRTHAFRHRAARTITQAGGSFAQLLEAGQWHETARRFCLVPTQGDARARVEASGDESPAAN